jgi:hypothetical protein
VTKEGGKGHIKGKIRIITMKSKNGKCLQLVKIWVEKVQNQLSEGSRDKNIS